MKPLTIVTVFNRKGVTQKTLQSLDWSISLDSIDLCIVDNGSSDGVTDWLKRWTKDKPVTLFTPGYNLGVSRALNYAIRKKRQAGQPVLKLDNDVCFLNRGWLDDVENLINYLAKRSVNTAIITAHYDVMFTNKRVLRSEVWNGNTLYCYSPSVGNCAYYTGSFMDKIGYFDVLSSEHIYGFEDLMASHKANKLGWSIFAWEGWKIENLQHGHGNGNCLGEHRKEYIAALRPLYEERVRKIFSSSTVYTDYMGCL